MKWKWEAWNERVGGRAVAGASGTQKSYLCLEQQDKLRCSRARRTKDSHCCLVCSIRKNALTSLSITFSIFKIGNKNTRLSTDKSLCYNVRKKQEDSTLTRCCGGEKWGQLGHTSLFFFSLTNLQCARFCTSHFTIINSFHFCHFTIITLFIYWLIPLTYSRLFAKMAAMIPLTVSLSLESPLPHGL